MIKVKQLALYTSAREEDTANYEYQETRHRGYKPLVQS